MTNATKHSACLSAGDLSLVAGEDPPQLPAGPGCGHDDSLGPPPREGLQEPGQGLPKPGHVPQRFGSRGNHRSRAGFRDPAACAVRGAASLRLRSALGLWGLGS